MATETGWRAHQRAANDPQDRSAFSGRRFAEDTDAVDASTFEDSTYQMPELPELPSYLKTVGLAAAAAAGGMALGYWLGGRRASRRRSSFALGDVDFGDLARLAPEIAHLLKNPAVRALATRLAMRQLRRYLDS